MARVKYFLSLFSLAAILFSASPATSQTANPLPDAPQAGHASDTRNVAPNKWYGVVDPGENAPPLSTKDKMVFWLHEEISPLSLVPAVFSAGYDQVTNGDPKYGSDSAAFGERFGAAALRDASMRFFSDSLLPTLTHTDPRYFRMGSGGFKKRAGYVVKRLIFVQNDSGHQVLNYDDILGRLAGASLTPTYYPGPSTNAGVVFETWGIALGGSVGSNAFYEFWPDVRDAVFHHNRKSKMAKQSSTP
jgi:hypothetical protein